MAYGSYYPQTYYPTYYGSQMIHNQPQVTQNQQNTATNMIWCQGENAAKSYPVAPGQTVQLMDSEAEGVMYIKSVDPSGMPLPLRTFQYSEKKSQNSEPKKEVEAVGGEEYVSKTEFNNYKEDMRRYLKKLRGAPQEKEGDSNGKQPV